MPALKLRESQDKFGCNIVSLSWRVIKSLYLIPFTHWRQLYEMLESYVPFLDKKYQNTFSMALQKCKERSLRNRNADWTVIFIQEGLIDSTSNKTSSQILH